MRPLAIDLFCGAGGASVGLYYAGFDVIGVDRKKQPRYPFPFVQGDALRPPFDLKKFAVLVWASPPCQAHTSLRTAWNAKHHEDLIPQTRELLRNCGCMYVIENVVGAPLLDPVTLCGSMFSLGWEDAELRRHRKFESNFEIPQPACRHKKPRVIGVYGGHGRDRRRNVNAQDYPTHARRSAMGIDWMDGQTLSQAIPPAYSAYIGTVARLQL